MHHPDTLPQRDPRHRPARDGGPVDGFGHLEVVGSGDVLDDAVASIVPDIHSEGEVRLGFHGQGRLDSPWPAGIYTALLLRPEYLSQNLDRALPTKDGGTLRTIGEVVQYMTGIGKKRELRSQWRRVAKLILAKENVLSVSRALELALFMDAKLDVSKVPAG
jgi:hypothetical protein